MSKKDKSLNAERAIARQRLKRDFIELQREKLLSINAHPLDYNIFEWHANISPTDGVYSGVYFHLILIFPHSYPTLPPKVTILTPISHPNVLGSFICLSMLRKHTTAVPYEGWSGAYSVTSILMQLQSFLFADKIDQDGGYQIKAQLSSSAVKQSIGNCKSFKCSKCSHTHETPWPKVQGPPDALIKVYPMGGKSKKYVRVQGSHCITTHGEYVGAYGQYGCNYGKIMYEAFVDWIPIAGRYAYDDEDNCSNIANISFGFGTEYAFICGQDIESFGYMGNGAFIYNEKRQNYGATFGKNDTITCAIDFDTNMIYFAKNGMLMNKSQLYLPKYLSKQQLLYPVLSFKQARAEFNFGKPKKPCAWLIQNGFKTLEQIAMEHGITNEEKTDHNNNENKVNWHSRYVIPELWVDIFSHLSVQDVYSVQFVCKRWRTLVHKYNVTERTEMFCYFTKDKLGQKGPHRYKILGIGVHISESEVGFRVELNSQMDILSLNAWMNGVRVGVWGEKLTHFLPLVMNKQHAELSHEYMIKHLKLISLKYKEIQVKSYHGKQREDNPNKLELEIKNSECLQLVDTLITMMNQIVAQFVTGNEDIDPKTVNMVLCEKVLIGYCYLHHLLLYLKSKNKKKIISFANRTVQTFIHHRDGPSKEITRDLGKFLIYLMISSRYKWSDVARYFVEESFTRRVRWFVRNELYAKYDTTQYIDGRVHDSFISSKTGRRLVMFQVWFMKNNATETLQGYNYRLGRPKHNVKHRIVGKSKQILQSMSYIEYFKELDISSLNSQQSMDQLLRFAVYNSYYRGYHWRKDVSQRDAYYIYKIVHPPRIVVINNEISNINSKNMSNRNRNKNKKISKQKQSKQIITEQKMEEKNQKIDMLTITNKMHVQENKVEIEPNNRNENKNNKVVNEPKQQTMSKAQRRKRRKNKVSQDVKQTVTNGQKMSQTRVTQEEIINSKKQPIAIQSSDEKHNEQIVQSTNMNSMRKSKMRPTRPPLPNKNKVNGNESIINNNQTQTRAPLQNTSQNMNVNNNTKTNTQKSVQTQNKPKLSKAQRRKQRLKKNKNKNSNTQINK